MKKIVFYIGSLAKGGAQRVILNLAQSLLQKGYAVTIVTTGKSCEEYPLPKQVKRVYSDIDGEEITGSRIRNFLRRCRKLHRIWKTEQADVIVSFIGKNNFMALLTAWGLSIPVITSVRGEPTQEYYSRGQRLLSKTLMGCSAGIILQTPDAAAYFPKWMQKKIVILDNPLNPEFIDSYEEGERKKEIVTVGRMDPNKNQKLLIDAFGRIEKTFPEYRLILYGDGETYASLQEYVRSLPFGEKVSLPGAAAEIKEKIRKAKLFVLPSNTEGMPNALMEALALGIPCVSTDCPCGGPKRLMEGKHNGILVPVGDVQKMAEAMETLLADDRLWQEYSRNAYQLTQTLDPERVNAAWEQYLISFSK